MIVSGRQDSAMNVIEAIAVVIQPANSQRYYSRGSQRGLLLLEEKIKIHREGIADFRV